MSEAGLCAVNVLGDERDASRGVGGLRELLDSGATQLRGLGVVGGEENRNGCRGCPWLTRYQHSIAVLLRESPE